MPKKSGRNAKTSGLKVSAAKDGDLGPQGECSLHRPRARTLMQVKIRKTIASRKKKRLQRSRNIPAATATINTATAHTHQGGGHFSQKIVS